MQQNQKIILTKISSILTLSFAILTLVFFTLGIGLYFGLPVFSTIGNILNINFGSLINNDIFGFNINATYVVTIIVTLLMVVFSILGITFLILGTNSLGKYLLKKKNILQIPSTLSKKTINLSKASLSTVIAFYIIGGLFFIGSIVTLAISKTVFINEIVSVANAVSGTTNGSEAIKTTYSALIGLGSGLVTPFTLNLVAGLLTIGCLVFYIIATQIEFASNEEIKSEEENYSSPISIQKPTLNNHLANNKSLSSESFSISYLDEINQLSRNLDEKYISKEEIQTQIEFILYLSKLSRLNSLYNKGLINKEELSKLKERFLK